MFVLSADIVNLIKLQLFSGASALFAHVLGDYRDDPWKSAIESRNQNV